MASEPVSENLKKVLKSRSIQKLAETSSEALGCPVMVLDASLHIMARSCGSDMPDDAKATLPLGQQFTPIHIFSCADPEFSPGGDISYYLNRDSEGRSSRWARYTITIGFRTVGYLCAVLGSRKPDPEFADLLEWIARFALVLLVSEQPSSVFGSREQFFFTTLINSPGENNNDAILDGQCRKLGISLPGDRYILTTHMSPQNFTHPVALESLMSSFDEAISNSYSFLYKENIVTVFSSRQPIGRLGAFLAPLVKVLTDSYLICGVSSDFRSLTEVSHAYNQAIRAINLGNRLSPGGCLFLYEDYMHYDMMSLCEPKAELLDFCCPAVRRLFEYDAEHSSAHLNTLYAYLTNGGSIIKTAEELDVHRNTVKYRISQISQIIGVDLGEGLDIFPLLRSLEILRYLGKLK